MTDYVCSPKISEPYNNTGEPYNNTREVITIVYVNNNTGEVITIVYVNNKINTNLIQTVKVSIEYIVGFTIVQFVHWIDIL